MAVEITGGIEWRGIGKEQDTDVNRSKACGPLQARDTLAEMRFARGPAAAVAPR